MGAGYLWEARDAYDNCQQAMRLAITANDFADGLWAIFRCAGAWRPRWAAISWQPIRPGGRREDGRAVPPGPGRLRRLAGRGRGGQGGGRYSLPRRWSRRGAVGAPARAAYRRRRGQRAAKEALSGSSRRRCWASSGERCRRTDAVRLSAQIIYTDLDSPAQVVSDYATDHGFDLLVLGRHGNGQAPEDPARPGRGPRCPDLRGACALAEHTVKRHARRQATGPRRAPGRTAAVHTSCGRVTVTETARCTTRSSTWPGARACAARQSSGACKGSAPPRTCGRQGWPRYSGNEPVLIEITDDTAKVEAFLPAVGQLVSSGLIITKAVTSVRRVARHLPT